MQITVVYNPAYSGQLSDLPFQDPFWKVILCIVALALLIGSAIAEGSSGSGEISTTGGPGGSGSPTGDCCGLTPSWQPYEIEDHVTIHLLIA
jgi:hypothetical protein